MKQSIETDQRLYGILINDDSIMGGHCLKKELYNIWN